MARLNRKLAAGLLTASMMMTLLTASACDAANVTTVQNPDGTVTTTITGSGGETATVTSAGALADISADYDEEDATVFTFTDSAITAKDGDYTGYKIEGTNLTIKEAGTYVLTGSCADGSVTVKKGTTGVVLVLAGLDLANKGTETTATAPLALNKSTGVTVVVAAGTVNTLTDSVYNNDETYTENAEAENAVLKCKDGSQVVITGTGTLNIVSNGKNAIKSGTTDSETDAANPRDAFLTIAGPTLNITANVNDAINAEQELNILAGTLTISAADDAIHSDLVLNIGESTTSAGPVIDIVKSEEGIEGATINIYSGELSIVSNDDIINAANADLGRYDFSINIYGGTIKAVSATGDGIDSNGSLNISGGTVEIWCQSGADNQPLDADGAVNITGGTVLAAGMSAGMGMNLNATQNVVTYGGATGMMGGFGGMGQTGSFGGQFRQDGQSGQTQMTPPDFQNNGQMQMTPPDQSGTTDGTQQNGMRGGRGQTGQTQQGGMTGQTGGMGQMGGMFGRTDTSNATIAKGATVAVTDEAGNVLYETTALGAASYIVFSSADLSANASYTLTANGTSVGTAAASTAQSMGGFGGQNGQTQQGGMPGQMGGFGGQFQQDGQSGQTQMTPPDFQNNGQTQMTPPDLQNGGQTQMMPPDFQNGGQTQVTPPDFQNNGQIQMTPPDLQNGVQSQMPTPPALPGGQSI